MQMKSLKVFCDVVAQKSFSRAAGTNGISQSGASQVVHQLEERLGVKLIDRSKRPFVLTPEGKVYYRGCRKVVREYFALEEKVKTFHDQVSGLVRVASIYSVGLSHMNRDVQEFMSDHPRAHVRLEYHHPKQVYDLVERDQVDIGLVSYPRSSRSLQVIPWREEPMVLVCAPDHLFAQRTSIQIDELDGAKMVGFDRDLMIRRKLDRTLSEHGAEVDVVMEFDNIETIKRAIEIDSGVAILPEPTVTREVAAGSLAAVRLITADGEPVLTRPLGIVHRRGEELSGTVTRFVQALQKKVGRSIDAPAAKDRKEAGRRRRQPVAAVAESVQ